MTKAKPKKKETVAELVLDDHLDVLEQLLTKVQEIEENMTPKSLLHETLNQAFLEYHEKYGQEKQQVVHQSESPSSNKLSWMPDLLNTVNSAMRIMSPAQDETFSIIGRQAVDHYQKIVSKRMAKEMGTQWSDHVTLKHDDDNE